jgi:hypothetical protein
MIVFEPKGLFNKDGITHKLIKYSDTINEDRGEVGKTYGVGIYELSPVGENDVVGYNVHRMRVRFNSFDQVPYLAQPATGLWGVDGFSYYNLYKALVKFEELL